MEVEGGTYCISVNSAGTTVYGIVSHAGGSTTIKDAKISAELLVSMAAGKATYAVYCNGILNIDNCDIKLYTASGLGCCVYINKGESKITNTKAFADSLSGSSGYSAELGNGYGVRTQPNTVSTIVNCDIYGAHSGCTAQGETVIKNCVLRGTGHGGVYATGDNSLCSVENSRIESAKYEGNHKTEYKYFTQEQDVIVPAQYDETGLYVGLGNNTSVYLDNCKIVGGKQGALVLRGSDGEQNNSVYMSNCTIETDHKARIDNNTLKLYVGFGNNFTAEEIGLPEAVVAEPTKIYVKEG